MSRPYTVEQLKALASLLRKALGFQTTKRLNMRVVLTKFRQLYPDFNYLVVKDDELPDAEAKYDPTTRILKIADRTFKALENGSPRAAFTIAHELGHPILQHTEIRFRHAERKVYERAKPNIYREEREADQFAAFLLAPDHLAEGCRTVEDFMRTFGLGRRAAEIRKEQYDRDLRRKAGEERPLPSNVVDFLGVQKNKGHKVTALKPERQKVQTTTVPQFPPASKSHQALKTIDTAQPETEICSECGNLSLQRAGVEWRCSLCGLRLQV